MQQSQQRVARGKKSNRSNLIFTIKKIKNQKKWTREEDELLIALAEKYQEKHWKEISKKFTKKNSLQCFSRYKRIRPGIVKGSWKKDEDRKIEELVFKYGKSWSKISKLLGTRNGKQIRDRFINVLDPEIRKGKFTKEEDSKLVVLFKQHGPKWATIAKYYPNRTADMIKNRFHSSIKKKLGSDQIKEYKEELTICKNDYSTDDSSKSLINLSNTYQNYQNNYQNNIQQFSIHPYQYLKQENPLEVYRPIQDFDNKNFNTSTLSSGACESDYLSQYTQNYYDFLPIQQEIKQDDYINCNYISNNCFNQDMWSPDDFFTL